MLSFDSVTLGSSNGLMPSTAPATAVANSQRKNSPPSAPAPPSIDSLSTGWPAAASASSAASVDSCHCSIRAGGDAHEDAVVVVHAGIAERLAVDRHDAARRACRCSRRRAARSRRRASRSAARSPASACRGPARASVPSTTPSHRPGLSAVGSLAALGRGRRVAQQRVEVEPISAAGTRPTYDSAL